MKIKCFILLIILFLLCGCSNIQDRSIDNVINNLKNDIKENNTYHTGYKYYVPHGMSVTKYTLYNDVIETSDYTYYLYVDLISYNNKKAFEYEENPDAYYSKKLAFNDKKGYLEINLNKNEQYLIEIMFNYAKIEVMVDYKDINTALSYAVSILRSIEYNDSIIANMLGDDILASTEEVYDIFAAVKKDSNYLKYEDAIKQEEENAIKDMDLIN